LLYSEFIEQIKDLGFSKVEDFVKYIGGNVEDILIWQEQDDIPYTISLIIHLLKGQVPSKENSLDILVEECLPLAQLLEESSSFPAKLEEMFLLQKKLNDETNGPNWELGVNKFDKEINWLRCIHMEVAELIESAPWKHWKNIASDPDLENIHIELVDIWHFLMSYILQETNVPKAVSLVNTHCIYESVDTNNVDIKLLIKEAEKLSYISLAIQTGNMPAFSGVERFIEQFFRCCKIAGLSFTWLQKVYIGKNCLNKFRQDNGYKEGSYIKVWDGKEDNVVMMSILENLSDLTFDTVYKQLTIKYNEIKKDDK
jgi:dimeric dUTPase (all-alpha-NTP-PPase superfamily)